MLLLLLLMLMKRSEEKSIQSRTSFPPSLDPILRSDQIQQRNLRFFSKIEYFTHKLKPKTKQEQKQTQTQNIIMYSRGS